MDGTGDPSWPGAGWSGAPYGNGPLREWRAHNANAPMQGWKPHWPAAAGVGGGQPALGRQAYADVGHPPTPLAGLQRPPQHPHPPTPLPHLQQPPHPHLHPPTPLPGLQAAPQPHPHPPTPVHHAPCVGDSRYPSQQRYSQPAPPLSAGWTTAIDPASRRPYFINTVTHTTQWDHPASAVTAVTAVNTVTAGAAATSAVTGTGTAQVAAASLSNAAAADAADSDMELSDDEPAATQPTSKRRRLPRKRPPRKRPRPKPMPAMPTQPAAAGTAQMGAASAAAAAHGSVVPNRAPAAPVAQLESTNAAAAAAFQLQHTVPPGQAKQARDMAADLVSFLEGCPDRSMVIGGAKGAPTDVYGRWLKKTKKYRKKKWGNVKLKAAIEASELLERIPNGSGTGNNWDCVRLRRGGKSETGTAAAAAPVGATGANDQHRGDGCSSAGTALGNSNLAQSNHSHVHLRVSGLVHQPPCLSALSAHLVRFVQRCPGQSVSVSKLEEEVLKKKFWNMYDSEAIATAVNASLRLDWGPIVKDHLGVFCRSVLCINLHSAKLATAGPSPAATAAAPVAAAAPAATIAAQADDIAAATQAATAAQSAVDTDLCVAAAAAAKFGAGTTDKVVPAVPTSGIGNQTSKTLLNTQNKAYEADKANTATSAAQRIPDKQQRLKRKHGSKNESVKERQVRMVADLVQFIKDCFLACMPCSKFCEFLTLHPQHCGLKLKLKTAVSLSPRLRNVPADKWKEAHVKYIGNRGDRTQPAPSAAAATAAAATTIQSAAVNPGDRRAWPKPGDAARLASLLPPVVAMNMASLLSRYREVEPLSASLGEASFEVLFGDLIDSSRFMKRWRDSAGEWRVKRVRLPGCVDPLKTASDCSHGPSRWGEAAASRVRLRGDAPIGTVLSVKPVGMAGRQSSVASGSVAEPGIDALSPDNSDASNVTKMGDKGGRKRQHAAMAADLVVHLEALKGFRMSSTEMAPFLKRHPQHKGVGLKAAVKASSHLAWVPFKLNGGMEGQAVALRPKAAARAQRSSSTFARPSGGNEIRPDPSAATAVPTGLRDGSGVVLGQKPSTAGMARPTGDPNAPPNSTFPAHRFVDAQVTAISHGNRYFVVDRWVYCSFDILAGASKPPRVGETMTVQAFHWPTPTACQWRACAYEAPDNKERVPDPPPDVRLAVHPGSCAA